VRRTVAVAGAKAGEWPSCVGELSQGPGPVVLASLGPVGDPVPQDLAVRPKVIQMPMRARGDSLVVSATGRDSAGSERTADVDQDRSVEHQGSESTDLHRTGVLWSQDNGVGSGAILMGGWHCCASIDGFSGVCQVRCGEVPRAVHVDRDGDMAGKPPGTSRFAVLTMRSPEARVEVSAGVGGWSRTGAPTARAAMSGVGLAPRFVPLPVSA
jgi:hypothetical protein